MTRSRRHTEEVFCEITERSFTNVLQPPDKS
jgi:hypothetical protein